MELLNRPRRLRGTPVMRSLIRETRVSADSLVYPLFVQGGARAEIASMPGQYRHDMDSLLREIEQAVKCGVPSVMLFGIPDAKDECGSGAWAQDGIVQQAVARVKREFPQILLMTDVCLCEYTSHGHCGMLNGETVDNDKTLPLLAKTAVSHVQAGADVVAPSDMMDGRVLAIREALDEHGFCDTPILSYAVKYASAFYGPFRDAADSAPVFGDRKSYQMDYHNKKEALKEAQLDLDEGADMLMVKPALAYLDVLQEVSRTFDVPVAAYSVSGEYAMTKAAARNGWIDEAAVVCEAAVACYRAGADILITYYAKELAQWMREGRIG